jgi:hypothetical protein
LFFSLHLFSIFEIFRERLQVFFVLDVILENLQHDVVGHWILSLRCLQKFFVESDGAALALDVLIEYGLDEWVIRGRRSRSW